MWCGTTSPIPQSNNVVKCTARRSTRVRPVVLNESHVVLSSSLLFRLWLLRCHSSVAFPPWVWWSCSLRIRTLLYIFSHPVPGHPMTVQIEVSIATGTRGVLPCFGLFRPSFQQSFIFDFSVLSGTHGWWLWHCPRLDIR